MNQPGKHNERNYLLLSAAALLIIGFFIPWVAWDNLSIKGSDLPLGNFFKISEENFYLANPFPQFDLSFYLLWLIPILAAIILILSFLRKRSAFVSLAAGILALVATTVFILFSNSVLADLGVKYSLKPGIFITILAAIVLIIASSVKWWAKMIFIIAAPLSVWIGFSLISTHLMNEEFGDTANTKPDYTVNALEMISEFQANDSLANAKYLEKIVVVNGSISEIQQPNDSTVNVKFIDSTTGSYVIFPFTGKKVEDAAKLKEEENVSLKGSCSGAVYSEILGAWFISFKRSVINKN